MSLSEEEAAAIHRLVTRVQNVNTRDGGWSDPFGYATYIDLAVQMMRYHVPTDVIGDWLETAFNAAIAQAEG